MSTKSSGQSRLFFLLFGVTGGAVFWLARQQQPAFAAAAGIAGILIHWAFSSGNDSDAELADSSYFLGFLLTLVLLAAGLWSLAGAGSGNGARPTGAVLYQFLYDLGAGLTITVAGLAIRQVRTLSAVRATVAAEPPPVQVAPQQNFEPLLRELIEAVNRLPANVAAHEARRQRVDASRPVEAAERSIAEAAPRIIASMARLEDSVSATATTLTRTASSLGDSLTQTAERIDVQLGDVLQVLAKERTAMLTQLEEWKQALANAHNLLVDGHQTLDTEYRRGLLAVSAAGRSFTQLSNQVAADINRLPDPGERLVNLWTGVETLDARLRDSIGDAGARLAALGAQAQAASASVERLSQSLRTASTHIERGGGEMSATLERELRDVSKVLDDFVGLLNERVSTIGAG